MAEFDKNSMFNDFIKEIYKCIDIISRQLDMLEDNINNSESIENILRSAHTIKGTSDIMNFEFINSLTSIIEQIIEKVQQGDLMPTERVTTLLKDANDGLRIMVSNVEGDTPQYNQNIWEELGPVLKEIFHANPEGDTLEETGQEGFANDDILGFFILETEEYIEIFRDGLKKLQNSVDDIPALETLLTTAHTLKGSAAMMELVSLSRLARLFESAMKKIRNKELNLDQAIDLLFETVDGFEAMIDQIKKKKIGENKEILSIFEGEYEKLPSQFILQSLSIPEVEPEESSNFIEDSHTSEVGEGDDPDDLIVLFAQEAYKYVEKIHDDVNNLIENPNDKSILKELEVTAHTLKGTALTMGHNSVGRMASEFQEISQLAMDDETELDDGVIAVFEKCSAYLKEMVDNIVDEKEDENDLILQNLRPEMEWIIETAREKEIEVEPASPKEYPEIAELSQDMKEYFLTEASEHLQNIDQDLLALEREPDNQNILNSLFRSLHTLKGSSSIVGYVHISNLSHIMEDVLDKARKNQIAITEKIIDLLLEGLDTLKKFLNDTSKEVFITLEILTAKLNQVLTESEGISIVQPKLRKTSDQTLAPAEEFSLLDSVEKQIVRINISDLDRLMNLVGELVINRARLDQRLSHVMNLSTELETSKYHLINVVKNFHRKYEFTQSTGENPNGSGSEHKAVADFHDLEFDKYDDYNILSRNLFGISDQMTGIMNELVKFFGEFHEETTHISTVTNELQEGITNIRMVPVDRLFRRYQRPIRDLAKAQNKEVNLVFKGTETVLDKRLVEELADPILHIVRNAIYHGIELPVERERKGKARIGQVVMQARHEGDKIIIEIQDDGAGINYQHIKEVALKRGHINPTEFDTMQEADALNLIYLPGMSTVDQADRVSGRGVGMDVVFNNLMALNGSIDIETGKDEGTKFIIALPLTLAITKALLLEVGNETFAINLNSVLEILYIHKSEIQKITNEEVISIRGKVIPLKRLANILSVDYHENGEVRYPVVIVGTPERRTALLVNGLAGREDIVVKSIGEYLGDVKLFSGATISGEGKVRLILDVPSIVGYTIKAAGKVKITKEVDEIGESPQDLQFVTPKILLIDDSISIRKFVGKLLEKSGFHTTVAVDGLDALEKVKEEYFHLFIVDLEMPRMHGYELIEQLRKLPEIQKCPIVVMTSRSGEKHRQKALALGANDYIVKPFTEDLLISTINRLLNK